MTLANGIGVAYLVVGLTIAAALYAIMQGDLRLRGIAKRDTDRKYDADLNRELDDITDTIRRGLQSPQRWRMASLIALYLVVVIAAWPLAILYTIVQSRTGRGQP